MIPIFVLLQEALERETTITSELIHNLECRSILYQIAAPTGKATSRAREVTKRRSPSTIHRLIARSSLVNKFQYLIIDESSMVTTELFYNLIKTFTHGYKIIMIGDINQLQPIGWGTLFEQLISSKKIPVYELSVNHRVDKTRLIEHENGLLINSIGIIESPARKSYKFVETDNFKVISGGVDSVNKIVQEYYDQGNSVADLTIITPYNENINQFNDACQKIFNSEAESIEDMNGDTWALGDKVMLDVEA